jgi:hypothetical protein
MKALATGKTFTIWECPHAAVSAELAIEEAKAAIDGSALDVAGDVDEG